MQVSGASATSGQSMYFKEDSLAEPPAPARTIWSFLASAATFGRVKAKVAPTASGSKRTLQRSVNAAIWMVSGAGG